VAAALRVNGDTVADDSLAELDEITGNDIVATLARIVTGETQLEAPNLQQAFAEANAGIRQANAIIGEYEMAAETVPAQQKLARDVGVRAFHMSRDEATDTDEPVRMVPPEQDGGSSAAQHARVDGKANGARSSFPDQHQTQEKEENGKFKMPPVPKPRLVLGQLRSR
jgi:hypothetical protein